MGLIDTLKESNRLKSGGRKIFRKYGIMMMLSLRSHLQKWTPGKQQG